MLTKNLTVYLSGAQGNLGSEIAIRLESRSEVQLVKLKRDSENSYVHALESFYENSPGGQTFLIHCGWDVSNRRIDKQEICLEDTQKLADFCQPRGIKMVFISSTSASNSAKSNYGKMKFRAQQSVLKAGGLVLRPGLVIFERPKGIQKYFELMKRSNFQVSFLPNANVTTINAEQLINEIESCLKDDTKRGLIECLGNNLSTLNALCTLPIGKSKRRLLIPLKPLALVLRLAGRLNGRMKSIDDSLRGII